MNKYSVVGLYDHNAVSYEKIKQGLLCRNIVSIIHATGTGKSYNALQLAYDNKDKKITYIVPSNSIIEHLKEVIEENSNLELKRDFPNLEFRTYQSLINMSDKELSKLDIDLLVLDEFHHIGAPVWGAKINKIVETHENIKILGMTAYTVRDRGTLYERDMVNSEKNELFSDSVVSNYDLCDAMIDGVLPKPVYKSGYVYLDKTADALEQRLEKLDHNSKDYKELSPLLKDIKKRIHEAHSIKDIFKINIKPNGKYIYFCPLGVEDGKNDIKTIMEETKNWVKEMGLTEEEYEFYVSTSEMGKEGKKNRKAFYNDEDLDGNKTNDKLRIMFAINQYNEGVHAPGLDGVIMGRGTSSDIIYFEQLGRALSVRGRTKEEYEKLYSKTLDELINLCNKREIKINDINSKEEIIEQLLSPTIIDLANNINFIKNLENNLKDRVKEIESNGLGEKRIIHLKNTSFDIDMINEDIFKILEYMSDRLTMTWEDKYELAKAYYKHHGNLEISARFKTLNGIDYDENGVSLGTWIVAQRQAYNGRNGCAITQEKIKLLEEIGMRFETRDNDEEWNKKYELAKAYYKHHGILEISPKFKTTNGIDYDENGVSLGTWIVTQRQAYKGKGTNKITKEKIKLLEEIGMRFETRDNDEKWKDKYELAKAYYKHHGNLKIPYNFKTINGIDYDENGILLRKWVTTQRSAYNGKVNCNMTQEKIKLLEEIGMNFKIRDNDEEWNKKYELAKVYYKYHGNLEISHKFKTRNGIDYDENGVALGSWIATQRSTYKVKVNCNMTQEKIKLLEEIGMRFETSFHNDEWNKKYELAKAYYKHHGNLEIPFKFKTANGIDYDENGVALGTWIDCQRRAYKGKGENKITQEKIKLLEEIGINFKIRDNDEEWNKKYELSKVYYKHYGNLEMPFKFKTANGIDYDENGVALGSWIATQRNAYNSKGTHKITQKQIKLLEEIGMKWYSTDKIDYKYQLEQIDNSNSKMKQIEILNRVKSYLNSLDDNQLPSKDELNQGLLDQLNHVQKIKKYNKKD